MAASAFRTVRDAVKARRFDGAYYVHGEDEFQKDDAVRQMVEAAVDPATRDFNLEYRRGAELDPEVLDSLLGTPPLMAERRVVVIRDATGLRRDARAALDRYLSRPASDVLLLLVAAPGAKLDKGLQAAATPLQFESLAPDRLPRWIAHCATEKFGATITPSAAELLQSAVGNDLYQLVSELDKLASYTGGAEITEDAVADVVGVRRGETLGDLLDRILDRDVTAALSLLPHVLSQPRTTAVSVVMALSTQMLALAWGRARLDEDGVSRGRLESEFFGLLKSTGAYPGRPWGQAAGAWARAVPEWSMLELDRAAMALLAADVALKESRVSSDEQIVATLVLTLCTPHARRAAA